MSLADSDLPPTVLSHCRSGPGRPPAMLQSLVSLRCQWAATAAASVPVTVTDDPEVDDEPGR